MRITFSFIQLCLECSIHELFQPMPSITLLKVEDDLALPGMSKAYSTEVLFLSPDVCPFGFNEEMSTTANVEKVKKSRSSSLRRRRSDEMPETKRGFGGKRKNGPLPFQRNDGHCSRKRQDFNNVVKPPWQTSAFGSSSTFNPQSFAPKSLPFTWVSDK